MYLTRLGFSRASWKLLGTGSVYCGRLWGSHSSSIPKVEVTWGRKLKCTIYHQRQHRLSVSQVIPQNRVKSADFSLDRMQVTALPLTVILLRSFPRIIQSGLIGGWPGVLGKASIHNPPWTTKVLKKQINWGVWLLLFLGGYLGGENSVGGFSPMRRRLSISNM